MKEIIEQIISGQRCPKCESKEVYNLLDKRFKCKRCGYKFSAQKIKNEFTLLHYFGLEIPANKAAQDIGFSYRKVYQRYMKYRQEILEHLDKEYKKLSGEIECDESYFGGKRKGARGRASRGKVKVFGMLERQGRIFTTIVDDVSAQTLMNAIKRHSLKGSVFYTDRFKSYKSLKFYGKHIEVDHDYIFLQKATDISTDLKVFGPLPKKGFLSIMVSVKNIFYFT